MCLDVVQHNVVQHNTTTQCVWMWYSTPPSATTRPTHIVAKLKYTKYKYKYTNTQIHKYKYMPPSTGRPAPKYTKHIKHNKTAKTIRCILSKSVTYESNTNNTSSHSMGNPSWTTCTFFWPHSRGPLNTKLINTHTHVLSFMKQDISLKLPSWTPTHRDPYILSNPSLGCLFWSKSDNSWWNILPEN